MDRLMKEAMPTISSFYGITISINLRSKEHNSPYIHAVYSGKQATFDLNKCELMEGDLGNKQNKKVEVWIDIHQQELLDMWNNQTFKTLSPLQ